MDRIFRAISRFFSVIVFAILIVFLLYAGTCVYANFFYKEPGEFVLPPVSKAQYEIIIRNTGNVLFTDAYDTEGDAYTLHGYWELKDNKYRRNKGEITLDQNIFGTITIRRR